jgi:hypothetical protein
LNGHHQPTAQTHLHIHTSKRCPYVVNKKKKWHCPYVSRTRIDCSAAIYSLDELLLDLEMVLDKSCINPGETAVVDMHVQLPRNAELIRSNESPAQEQEGTRRTTGKGKTTNSAVCAAHHRFERNITADL